MDSLRSTFRKSERLCSKKAISELFEKGNSFYTFPLQVVWLECSQDLTFPAQVAFSVSKRLFRRAVKRNLIKRRLRESYRKNKHLLYDILQKENRRINFIIIFKGETIPDYSETEKMVVTSLNKLVSAITRKSTEKT